MQGKPLKCLFILKNQTVKFKVSPATVRSRLQTEHLPFILSNHSLISYAQELLLVIL